MYYYISENDLLDKSHFPVEALFNEAANTGLVEFISNLIDETGSGFDFTSCSFWSELDEFDRQSVSEFSGLLIETEAGELFTASPDILQYYIELGCKRYTERFPDKDETISGLLCKFSEKYGLV